MLKFVWTHVAVNVHPMRQVVFIAATYRGKRCRFQPRKKRVF